MRQTLQALGVAACALIAAGAGAGRARADDCTIPSVRSRARSEPAGMTGRFLAGDVLLYVAACGPLRRDSTADTIAVSPAPWSAIEYALRVGTDSFAVFDRPRRTIVFVRDAAGAVVGMRTTGFDMPANVRRMTDPDPLPVERLLFDSSMARVVEVLSAGPQANAARARTLARTVFDQYPSRRRFVVKVVQRLLARWPADTNLIREAVDMYSVVGDIAAARRAQLRCAVAVSPPADWFDAMWAGSWPKTTVLRVALRTHATPFDEGGQFVERIMAILDHGGATLEDVRRRMIATSPLYFTGRLPATLVIAGDEDTSVPVRNAEVLDSAFRSSPGRTKDRSVVRTAMAGHDTDPIVAALLIREFLARHLNAAVGSPVPGGDAR